MFNHYRETGEPATGAENRRKLRETVRAMRQQQDAAIAAWERQREEEFPGRLTRFTQWVASQDYLTADDKEAMVAGFR